MFVCEALTLMENKIYERYFNIASKNIEYLGIQLSCVKEDIKEFCKNVNV